MWVEKFVDAFFNMNYLRDQEGESWYDRHGLVPGSVTRVNLNGNDLDVWAVPLTHR